MKSESADAEAVDKAARLLAAARQPVIAGLGTDIAGVISALRLAEKIGAAVDHDSAESELRQLNILKDTGMMLITAAEAAPLADCFLIIGERPHAAWPELALRLEDAARRGARVISMSPAQLGVVRARINGRPVGSATANEIDASVKMLQAAMYGVAVFAPEKLDALAIEMLSGLVKDLNETTRWSALPIPESVSAAGAMMAAGWMTGFPLRSAFINGRWHHDAWRFEARRMLFAGEADVAVYICCYEDFPPDWLPDIPAVLLINAARIPPRRNAIRIDVGHPGRDHDGVLYDRLTGGLVHRPASAPSNAPRAARVLDRIAARLAA